MERIRKPQSSDRKLIAFILIGVCCIAAICFLFIRKGKQESKGAITQEVNFSVQSNPLLDSQIYPSLILALNQSGDKELATLLAPFSVTVTSPSNGALLRVVADSSVFNFVTTFEEVLPHKGTSYTFHPTLHWKYDRLSTLRQSRPLDLAFTCYLNDQKIITRNLHLNLRTVNECPLSFCNTSNSEPAIQNSKFKNQSSNCLDSRWLFAAYVNEDHPYISQILTDILSQGIVSRITGYQNGSKAAREQVFAVWYYALDRGIAYSSISCTSNPSSSTNVQHIRFFDQVYNSRQANCIDACVFFASILRKIGLRPVIFVEPCHAYLGYYTDKKNDSKIELLETTITAWVNFPELEKSLDSIGQLPDEQFDKISKYLSEKQRNDYRAGKLSFQQLKVAVARSLFNQANNYNLEDYKKNKKNFEDESNLSFQQLDIEKLRQMVQPLPSDM